MSIGKNNKVSHEMGLASWHSLKISPCYWEICMRRLIKTGATLGIFPILYSNQQRIYKVSHNSYKIAWLYLISIIYGLELIYMAYVSNEVITSTCFSKQQKLDFYMHFFSRTLGGIKYFVLCPILVSFVTF